MAADARLGAVVVGVLGVGQGAWAADRAEMDAGAMMQWGTTGFVLAEVLEYAPLGDERPVVYDLHGWVGGARDRVWAKADGDQATTDPSGETELQLLYGRLVAPYWDLQIGVRVDGQYGAGEDLATRGLLALGVQGVAPGWFELEPTVFVSQRGHVSGQLTADYDLLLTQRLVLQPRLETRVAVQEVPEWGVGSGLNDLELGARLRYEIQPDFAPYVGVSWERRFAGTARLAEAAGEPVEDLSVVAGLRIWL